MIKDPKKRMGSNMDAEEIKSHPWFKNTDWASIINKCN